MDIKNYIASGVLEEYVLGLLEESQQKEVLEMAASHPEIRVELEKIEFALERYAQMKAVSPPVGLKQNILDQIEGIPTIPKEINKPVPKVQGSKLWQIATISLGLATAGLAYVYNQNNTELEERNKAYATLETNCNDQSADYERTIAILRNPDSRMIAMNGTTDNPSAATRIYVDAQRQTAFLDVLSLPEAPSEKDYQLWAIVDGKPVDMGIVPIKAGQGIVPAPYIASASAYAITLERKGGSPTPTLSDMVVIGEVG